MNAQPDKSSEAKTKMETKFLRTTTVQGVLKYIIFGVGYPAEMHPAFAGKRGGHAPKGLTR